MLKSLGDDFQGIIILQEIEGALSKYVSMPQNYDLDDQVKAKILKTHRDMGMEASFRTLTHRNFNFASYYSGYDTNIFLVIQVPSKNNPNHFELISIIVTNFIINNMNSEWTQHLPYLQQLILDFPEYNFEQILCKLALDPNISYILDRLRGTGCMDFTELQHLCMNELNLTIDLYRILIPLQMIGLIEILQVEPEKYYVFLIRDFFINRVPPLQNLKIAREGKFPASKKYLNEVQNYFDEYVLSPEDKIKLFDVFSDFELISILEKLREKPLSLEEIAQIKPKHRRNLKTIQNRLKILKLNNFITLYSDFPNHILLKSDIKCKLFFPEHLINLIESYVRNKTVKNSILLRYLELLKNTFYSFRGINYYNFYQPYQIKCIDNIITLINKGKFNESYREMIKTENDLFLEEYSESWCAITMQPPKLQSDLIMFGEYILKSSRTKISFDKIKDIYQEISQLKDLEDGTSMLAQADEILKKLNLDIKSRNQLIELSGILNDFDFDIKEFKRDFCKITETEYSYDEILNIIDTIRTEPDDARLFLETFDIIDDLNKDKLINILNIKSEKIKQVPKAEISEPKKLDAPPKVMKLPELKVTNTEIIKSITSIEKDTKEQAKFPKDAIIIQKPIKTTPKKISKIDILRYRKEMLSELKEFRKITRKKFGVPESDFQIKFSFYKEEPKEKKTLLEKIALKIEREPEEEIVTSSDSINDEMVELVKEMVRQLKHGQGVKTETEKIPVNEALTSVSDGSEEIEHRMDAQDLLSVDLKELLDDDEKLIQLAEMAGKKTEYLEIKEKKDISDQKRLEEEKKRKLEEEKKRKLEEEKKRKLEEEKKRKLEEEKKRKLEEEKKRKLEEEK
ncbi:MAG: hypothetical protein ACTSVE_08310, partial [Candidatus Helarchaeota archaeon]